MRSQIDLNVSEESGQQGGELGRLRPSTRWACVSRATGVQLVRGACREALVRDKGELREEIGLKNELDGGRGSLVAVQEFAGVGGRGNSKDAPTERGPCWAAEENVLYSHSA